MKLLLKLKHWQPFLLLMVIPILFQIGMFAAVFISNDPLMMFRLFPIVMILFMGIFFGWFYALGTNLHKKLPDTVHMNLRLFKIFLFIPVAYMSLFMVFMINMFSGIIGGEEPNVAIFMLIFPLHLFSMFCIFYCLYFNAKSLKSVELQKPVTSNDFAGEFFLIWFFPVGIWFLQPRINKLFEETEQNDLSVSDTNLPV